MSTSIEKLLWRNCFGKCSICRRDLIVEHEDNAFIGDLCHIESESEKGPRYNPNLTDYDTYENLVFLCCNCHRIVDHNTKKWISEEIRRVKKEHEEWVRNQPITALQNQKLDKHFEELRKDLEQIISDAYWNYQQFIKLADAKTDEEREKEKEYFLGAGTTERIQKRSSQILSKKMCPHCGSKIESDHSAGTTEITSPFTCPNCRRRIN